jgi:RNA polymerase-binding transcription factor DksA
MLGADERERVEKLLLQEREQLIEILRNFDRGRETSLQEDTGELTMYRLHPADIGTEAMEQEKQFLLASNEGRRLYEVVEALRRLYSKPEEFGVCERCGADISMERLEVVPAATLCATCQRQTESAAAGLPRS